MGFVIIINFPYSICISSFFSRIIPTSLFILKMFFRSCLRYFLTIVFCLVSVILLQYIGNVTVVD